MAPYLKTDDLEVKYTNIVVEVCSKVWRILFGYRNVELHTIVKQKIFLHISREEYGYRMTE